MAPIYFRIHWRIQEGGARDARPLGVQILSFPCNFWQKIWTVTHPLWENPGSDTGIFFLSGSYMFIGPTKGKFSKPKGLPTPSIKSIVSGQC